MTALYIRLSREDGMGRESNSVVTQRTILCSFAKGAGLTDLREYVDDGYSGTDTHRPAFLSMQADIEKGMVDTVIVKDLSRLARNSGVSNALIDEYFPLHKVRFISVSEGIDTAKDGMGAVFAPLANMMHEFYSRDISGKIRASLYAKMDEGRFVGSRAPLGYYVRDGKLYPDDDADTVRRIFALTALGYSACELSDMLSLSAKKVRRVVRDPVYLGLLEQGKTRKLSFKSRISVTVPKDERHRVLRTHKPLVTEELFRSANRMLEKRSRPRSSFENIFSGIAYCADCGSRMSTVGTRRKGSPCALACSRYKRFGADACTNHHIDYLTLCKSVVDAIRENIPDAETVSSELGISVEKAEELLAFDSIDADILYLFVERIEIRQGTSGKNRRQSIFVRFRFSSCEEARFGV